MASTPPSYLNTSFLEEAVRHAEKNPNIVVTSCEIKPATVAGDNFASHMYRAVLKIKRNDEEEEMYIIIKSVLPNIGEFAKLTEEIFVKESQYFSVLMPAMQELLDNAYTKKCPPFSAKYIHSTTSPQPTTIMVTDLRREGFKLAQVELGLDLNHALLVMKTIGRFHATSLVLHQKKPGCFNNFQDNPQVNDDDNKAMISFLSSNVGGLAKAVEKWEGFKDKYSPILHSWADDPKEMWVKGLRREDSGFNVLAHGDLWLNNMMFKYLEETGDVIDVRFVDYQLCYWTSPVPDLLYFMNSSVSPDVLEKREVLIEEYYNTLCETLSRLGYEELKPSKEALNKEIENKGQFGVLAAIAVRIVALSDRSKVPDMLKVIAKEEGIFLSDNYKQAMKQLLPLYEKWGWLTR